MDKIPEEERETKKRNFGKWIKNEFETELKQNFSKENKDDNKLQSKLNNYIFHLDETNLIGLMGKKLNEEASKFDSFKDYLEFYISNSNIYKINSKLFSDYIEERMSEDFKINFDDENKEDWERKNIKIEGKDKDNYVKFSNIIENDSKFDEFLTEGEYIKYKKLFRENKKKYIKPNEKGELERLLEGKMKKIIKDYFNIAEYLSMQQIIQKDFKINPGNEKKILIKKQLKEMIKNSKGIYDPKGFINDFSCHIRKIDELGKKKTETIENIKTNYKIIKNYLENSSSIRFLLVGPHNAGKSTLLNEIIGYNRSLLESANEECTKISVIVKYAQEKEIPKLFAADFHTNNLGYNYFEKKCLLAEKDKRIK